METGILGVDIGAVSLALAEVDEQGRILHFVSRPHAGDVAGTYADCLGEFARPATGLIAATTSSPRVIRSTRRVDNLVAAIRAALAFHPGLGALLVVGGEKFSLSLFRPDGSYRESRFNSLCAAGTGSFLDQQARRLGLSDSAALAATAMRSRGDRPRIATRCAVFAKTDLVHAQQEGFPLEAICDGLCRGLAVNVHDALFADQPPPGSIVFAGGVANNSAVVKHMHELLDRPLLVDEHASVYGAYGAAIDLLAAMRRGELEAPPCGAPLPTEKLVRLEGASNKSYYPPIETTRGSYPEFAGVENYTYQPRQAQSPAEVEVDIYRTVEPAREYVVYLGVDIGSTSTKAALLLADEGARPVEGDEGLGVLAGFYTRTAGRPLPAMQAILEAVSDWSRRADIRLSVAGAGVTGSGRKFIGALIGADLVLDEITAHARAAVRLDPDVDTIIEIGGQDAKFTILQNGSVTQSIMNHVCAAGTGSFIEEQAARLGCPLEEISERSAGRRAPLASDRCTVFMERDINQFLSDGYQLDEVLCSVLHAVRDNYLLKVARAGSIGQHICFQGATAKNRSLVAAFEQKLVKPIRVSRYCHLTGALGVAIELRSRAGNSLGTSSFRGLDLYAEHIPVRGEICDLCQNHCKLRIAEVRGQQVGYGYLCGRDPQDERFVSANRSGFDLLKARARHFRFKGNPPRHDLRIGLPAALYMLEELPFWKKFFDQLGVRTVTSEKLDDPVGRGKQLAQAEFCAPISAWHAHVADLAERADFIFTPFYLEAERSKSGERSQYCYYTQYAPSLTANLQIAGLADKCLMPVLHVGARTFGSWSELQRSLTRAFGPGLKRSQVVRAYKKARAFFDQRLASWPLVMREQLAGRDELAVVLLGRPYTVYAPRMNKGIPEILSRMGIKTFYQDMLAPSTADDTGEIADLLRAAKWHNVRKMLAAADRVARTPGLYPIMLTSFKCTPDACIIEYFRRLMNARGKPHLILQLDEHDSQVGYETRIEAALQSFRNHYRGAKPAANRARLPRVPKMTRDLDGRTLLVPPWDTLASPLFTAGLREVGIDAQLIDESHDLIQQSLSHNTGQCIPISIIVHEFTQTVRARDLDPARCALWLPCSSIGCNICFYPQYAKGLLETIGGGFERTAIYEGETSAIDVSPRATLNAFFAFLFGGMLRRMQCRLRPYEVHAGEVDRATGDGLEVFRSAILGRIPKMKSVRRVVENFLAIETAGERRPKVAVFGDLYSRDNDVLNQDLNRVIEAHGGEVVTTPYSEYIRIIAKPYLRKWLREGLYKDVLLSAPFAFGMDLLELPFRREFARVLGDLRPSIQGQKSEEILARFHVSGYHTGESFDNLLKIFHLMERYPDLALFVQSNPAFCCPSLVTEAMSREIERQTGVPVVTVTYDGTAASKNEVVAPYLELAAHRPAGHDRSGGIRQRKYVFHSRSCI